MYIKCEDIDVFCTMITTCSSNNIKDIRIFISEEDSYKKGLRDSSTPKDHKKFTYVLFTPLYTAIYSDSVKDIDYENIYKTLENCQEQCNHDFRIQIFDTLSFNDEKGVLTIKNEINVI